MAAHLGTGIQLAAVGPQNAYLDDAAGGGAGGDAVSLFRATPQRASRFAAEAKEVLPLQTPAFGRTCVFEVSHRGDMLGDMHVQITLPAAQPELGEGLPAADLPETAGADAETTAPVSWARGTVAFGEFEGAAGTRRAMASGQGAVWTFQREGRVWEVATFDTGPLAGLVRSTLRGGDPGTLTVNGLAVTQAVDATTAVAVGADGSVTAANDSWRGPLAYMLMRRARLVVDDLTLHDHERLWYDVADRLTLPAGHAGGLRALLGWDLSMGREHTVYLPLKFMCCQAPHRPRTYFPTALLSGSLVRVELQLEAFEACVPAPTVPTTPPTPRALLVAEHVYLEAEERNAMLLQSDVTIMYEGEQDMDGVNYSEAAVDAAGAPVKSPQLAVPLSELNLPVRALAWVVYDEATSVAEPLTYVGDAAAEVTLQIGSVERVAGVGGTFARQQVWTHARRCEAGGAVGLYSFALQPWGADPSGALDFSLVQKPVLRVQLRPEVAARQLKCKVFGLTYNWLRFRDGRVTRVFSG